MGFQVIKGPEQQKQYCDYIQNKFNIAKQYNTIYELTDEDKRIQKLYDDNSIKPVEKVRSISRVKKVEDGKECLVINKQIVFVDKITGMYRDRYSVREGMIELPLTTTNEDGVVEASQIKLEYDIPFSKSKVMEYLKKAGDREVVLRFYEGPETGNRLPNRTQVVGNLKFFLDATWEELLLGKEMGVVSSRVNKLSEVRESIPSDTVDDTNKIEEPNTNIVTKDEENIQKSKQTSPSSSGGGIKLKVSNPSDKKD